MQIVFIFHLSWPDKYFNQPTMLTCVSRETCFPQIIEIHFPSYPRFPLFTTSPTPLFSFFLVSSLLFLFRIFKYLSMYACYKILSLVDCAIENNHNDLTAILSSSIARSFIAI